MKLWTGEEPLQIYLPLTQTAPGLLKIREPDEMQTRRGYHNGGSSCNTKEKVLMSEDPLLSGCLDFTERIVEVTGSSSMSEITSNTNHQIMEYTHSILLIWNSRGSGSPKFMEDVHGV